MSGPAAVLRAQRRAQEDAHDEYVDALTGFLDARASELIAAESAESWQVAVGQAVQSMVSTVRYCDAKAITDPDVVSRARWADRADTGLDVCRAYASVWRSHPDFRQRWARP